MVKELHLLLRNVQSSLVELELLVELRVCVVLFLERDFILRLQECDFILVLVEQMLDPLLPDFLLYPMFPLFDFEVPLFVPQVGLSLLLGPFLYSNPANM